MGYKYPKTVAKLLERCVYRYPDKIGVISGNTRKTYKEIDKRVNAFVQGMEQLGLKKGDRIAILSKNSYYYAEILFGCAKGGYCALPVNWRFQEKELEYVIQDSEANAIIFQEEFQEIIDRITATSPNLRHRVILGKNESEALINYESLIGSSSATEPNKKVNAEDLYLLVYTSGTTGRPKGVMLSHNNIYQNALEVASGLQLGEDTVCLIIPPLFHLAGLSRTFLPTLYAGGTNIFLSEFDVKIVLETIQRESVTFNYTVPTMLFRVLDYEDVNKYDLSSLQVWGYGAAPMPLIRLKQAIDLVGPIMNQGYGMTESSGCVCMLKKQDHRTSGTEGEMKRLLSVGREYGNNELRVVNEDGEDVSPGEVGEVVIRSETVMQGYWKKPDATAETIRNDWLFTGDLATWDADRYIYLVDRKHDMIISGGENIYPKEVEEIIYRHPAVLEAAVVAVRHPDWGEVPKAFITIRSGMKVTEKEIIDLTRTHLAHYKCPKSVQFVDELPKTASGKIARSQVMKNFVQKSNICD